MVSVRAQKTRPAILLIENNWPMLDLYRRVLSRDYQVWACQDEHTAAEWLAKQAFHIVILEPAINQGKGWALFIKIRQMDGQQPIPVILISTSDEWKNNREVSSATFLLKPVLPAKLQETVRHLLHQENPL